MAKASDSPLIEGIFPALPALISATGVLDANTIMRFINLAIGIIASGRKVHERLIDLDDEIAKWVDAGKEPPETYWKEMHKRAQVATATIRELAEARRAER